MFQRDLTAFGTANITPRWLDAVYGSAFEPQVWTDVGGCGARDEGSGILTLGDDVEACGCGERGES